MTKEEMKELKGLAASMGLYDDKNPCKRAVILGKAIKALEQEPCDNAINRQAVLDALDEHRYSNEFCEEHHIDQSINLGMAHIAVNELPPVTPQQKIGKWIVDLQTATEDYYICSECERRIHLLYPDTISNYPYCHCGAKMQEVEK